MTPYVMYILIKFRFGCFVYFGVVLIKIFDMQLSVRLEDFSSSGGLFSGTATLQSQMKLLLCRLRCLRNVK